MNKIEEKTWLITSMLYKITHKIAQVPRKEVSIPRY